MNVIVIKLGSADCEKFRRRSVSQTSGNCIRVKLAEYVLPRFPTCTSAEETDGTMIHFHCVFINLNNANRSLDQLEDAVLCLNLRSTF